MTNNVESCKKINGRVQTFRFSVFTMGHQELFAENAKKNTKTRETKTQITQFFEKGMTYIGWYHEKADVLRIPKML